MTFDSREKEIKQNRTRNGYDTIYVKDGKESAREAGRIFPCAVQWKAIPYCRHSLFSSVSFLGGADPQGAGGKTYECRVYTL